MGWVYGQGSFWWTRSMCGGDKASVKPKRGNTQGNKKVHVREWRGSVWANRNRQQLGLSLKWAVKPFSTVWRFGWGVSFLNQFELGLGWLKRNRTDLGQSDFQAVEGLIGLLNRFRNRFGSRFGNSQTSLDLTGLVWTRANRLSRNRTVADSYN